MTLLIVLTLMALTAFVSFETGRRWTRGRKEIEAARAQRPAPVGRRGTVKLRSLKVNR